MADTAASTKLTGAKATLARKAKAHNLAFWVSTAAAMAVLGINAIRF